MSDLGLAQLLLVGSDTHLKVGWPKYFINISLFTVDFLKQDQGGVKGVDGPAFAKEKKLAYMEVDSVSLESVTTAVVELIRMILQNKFPEYKSALKTIAAFKVWLVSSCI